MVEETGVPWENHRPVACHWQTLSHDVVSSISRHDRDLNSTTLVLIGNDCIGSCKSNYDKTTTTTIPNKNLVLCLLNMSVKYYQNQTTRMMQTIMVWRTDGQTNGRAGERTEEWTEGGVWYILLPHNVIRSIIVDFFFSP